MGDIANSADMVSTRVTGHYDILVCNPVEYEIEE